MDQTSRENLLLKIARGDQLAFGNLYNQYAEILYRFLLPFVNYQSTESEEIVQEIFLKVWMKRETLPTVKNIETYLFQMAKNKAIDVYRVQKMKAISLGEVHENIQSQNHSSYQELLYQEYYATAQSSIDKLSPQRKRIFEMRTKEGLKLDEIALRLKISKSGVKKQLYEANHFVKSCLRKEQDLILTYLLFSILF